MVVTRTAEAKAYLLRDPNMMITTTAAVRCVLDTAINSQLPGFVSCHTLADVYSTNGLVLLVPRASKVAGQYQSAQLKPGMSRIFVMWTRIETPDGVLVNLDSPATDEVGRSGLDGVVDNHFWARFGAAMAVSLVDDYGQYLANKSSNSSGTSVTYTNSINGAQGAVQTVLQNTINIPPTLDKAQGGLVNIYVSRDLYFGNVYGLRSVTGR
jgi:type IV secretion system protein VirB10